MRDHDHELATLRQDLEALKRHNRWVKRMSVIVCALLVGSLSLAASSGPKRMSWSSYLNLKPQPMSLRKQIVTQPVGEVIQVSEIQILNASGDQVGFIGTDDAGDGVIILGDASGQPQAAVSVDESGAGLFSSFNASGVQAAILGTDLAGDGFVGLGNSSGELASSLGVGVTGAGFVAVGDPASMARASLGVDTLGVGRMTIESRNGDPVVEAYSEAGNGQIDVKTGSGVKIWASDDIPSAPSGGGDSGLIGDLDNDGDVDFADFLTFARNFGRSLSG